MNQMTGLISYWSLLIVRRARIRRSFSLARISVLVVGFWLTGVLVATAADTNQLDQLDEPAALRARMQELYRNGHYQEAIPVAQQSLTLTEQAFGPNHPDTARSLNDLAVLYLHLSDFDKAEPLLQRALAISENALGPDHPDTARSLNNLAGLYYQMGDYGKAEPLYQRALTIIESSLGPDHPNTAASLNNLALIYDHMMSSRFDSETSKLEESNWPNRDPLEEEGRCGISARDCARPR